MPNHYVAHLKLIISIYLNKTQIASKTIKQLGINLIEEVEDLYTENCMILMKGTEDTRKMEKQPMFMNHEN